MPIEYEFKNVYYFKHINELGGVESFYYYLSKIVGDMDIAIVCNSGDYNQIKRLRERFRVIMYTKGMTFKCEKAFFNFNLDIIDMIEAKEYTQVLHGIYSQLKQMPDHSDKITRYIGVSKAVCEDWTKLTGYPCELCYNPMDIEKPKKILHLVSATRLTPDKGGKQMEILAKKLDKEGVPYIWDIFTNDFSQISSENIVYHPPRLDVADYFRTADYVVQLSNEEGYGYVYVESLDLGVPLIVLKTKVIDELGIVDGKNAFVLEKDMSNLDVWKIYNTELKGTFKYERRVGDWRKIFAPGKSQYKEQNSYLYKVRVLEKYAKLRKMDATLLRKPITGEEYFVDFTMYDHLVNHPIYGQLVELVEKVKK